MTDPISEKLEAVVAGPEESIDLGRAALLVARLEYPSLDIDKYIGDLDALATAAGRRLPQAGGPREVIEAINQFLFSEQGFHGNADDYYDPRNSFLNQVVDRRTGIPITLSVIYLEIARRLALPFFGVGLPGHFVVKYDDGGQVIFVDPFTDGSVVDRSGCRELVAAASGRQPELRDVDFAAVEKRYIIRRILNNLCGIYLRAGQYRKGVGVLDLLIQLSAEAADLYKQRGLLEYQMRDFASARKDFENYLSLSPTAGDAEEIKKYISGLQTLQAMMN